MKVIFLFVGIGAGFLNVYRDSRRLLQKMAAEDARRVGAIKVEKTDGEHKDA